MKDFFAVVLVLVVGWLLVASVVLLPLYVFLRLLGVGA